MTTVARPKALSQHQIEETLAFCDWAKRDPVAWAHGALGFFAWSKQAEIIEACAFEPKVAVRSSHGVGKTSTVGRVVVPRDMVVHGLEPLMRGVMPSCRIVTTAPTFDPGVKRLLWPEIHAGASALNRTLHKLGLGQMPMPNLTDWTITPQWFAVGFSTDEPERFAGQHADYLRLIYDEASGVAEEIYNAGEGYQTGGVAQEVLIGNPTRTTGRFKAAFNTGSQHKQIHVSAYDSPAITGERVPERVRKVMPQQSWIDGMEAKYGRDDSEFIIRVLGEFAATSGRPWFHSLAAARAVEPIRKGRFTDTEPSRFVDDEHGALWVWEAPAAGASYVVAGDVAGTTTLKDDQAFSNPRDSGDYCAAQVVASDGRQVAEWHGRCDPDEFGVVLARLGRLYGSSRGGHEPDALVSVEANAQGASTLAELQRQAYRPLYASVSWDAKTRSESRKLGWYTTRQSREVMLAEMQATVREQPGLVRSSRLLAEMHTFVKDDLGRPAADAGCHDDLVMAAAQALEVRRQHFEELAPSSLGSSPRMVVPARSAAVRRDATRPRVDGKRYRREGVAA